MQQSSSFDARWVLIALVLMTAPGAAMAYIDPGSGAYMVQAIFTLVAAGLFYARHPIRSLRTFWRWVSNRSGEAPQEDPHAPGDQRQEKIKSGEN